ncbi:glycosyltransferase [Algoriphagus taiwanensis]|uniref:Streptomycin biosynthesis protein StrF domain-containing protein n=1 Tax=Algoriphagus taiwanensis TaxID=1445656 RepID=A0ABQ6Q6A7_9BACT|nr:hypothetical protein Ataiwa_39970 [Algoriphagus taiwanensis]
MISIIVLSNRRSLFSEFEKSVKLTIGSSFELIRVDNFQNQFSIFKGYNLGAKQAQNNILLFVHEDIIFHSKNWGKLLINYFETLSNPGVLGVAGCSYLPISPSDWWVGNRTYLHTNFLSNDKNGVIGEGKHMIYGDQVPCPVFGLDGMFLAMKKTVWEEFPFDESLKGFHGYDTSICYQVSKCYQNYFIPGILIEHFSKGYPNEVWLENTIAANRLVLPFILERKRFGSLDCPLEIKSYRLFLRQLMKFSSNVSYKFSYAWKYLIPVTRFTRDWRLIFYFFIFCFRYSLQALRIK